MNWTPFLVAFLRKELLEVLSSRTSLLLRIVGLGVLCLVYYHLGKMINTASPSYRAGLGGEYFPYFILGMATFEFTHTGLASFVRAVRQEASQGTFEILWLGRYSPVVVLLAMAAWPILDGLLQLTGFLVMGGILSPSVFQKIFLARFLATVVLAFLTYAWIGLFVIAWILVTKQGGTLVNLFSTLNFVLAGVLFPSSLLPLPLQWVSEALPLTHLLRLMRAEAKGASGSLLWEGSALLLLACVLYPLAWWCFKRAIRWTEREGSLSHF